MLRPDNLSKDRVRKTLMNLELKKLIIMLVTSLNSSPVEVSEKLKHITAGNIYSVWIFK